jgi:F5/8 type C domain
MKLVPATMSETQTPKIILANRTDGLGARLNAILNAMYLADRLGVDFKFCWKESSGKAIANRNFIRPATEIFTQAFVRDHCRNDINPRDFAPLPKSFSHDHFLQERDAMPHKGWVAVHVPKIFRARLATPLHEAKGISFPEAFGRIEFTPVISDAIAAARALTVAPESVAIHLRAGDIVNGRYRAAPRFTDKIITLPIAKELIKRATRLGACVYLFGQDMEALGHLKRAGNVVLASELDSGARHDVDAQALFEVIVMSRCARIYAGNSRFSDLAQRLGDAPVIPPNEIFSPQETADIIQQDLNVSAKDYPALQTAFAYWSAFHWNRGNLSPDERIAILRNAGMFDPENSLYPLTIASELLSTQRFIEGDAVLKSLMDQPRPSLAMLGAVGALTYKHPDGKLNLPDVQKNILAAAWNDLPGISFFASRIKSAGSTSAARTTAKDPEAMGAIFQRFGLDEAFVRDAMKRAGLKHELPSRADETAGREELEQAVRLITPVRCGIPLIRIGLAYDGGYLLPDDLDGIEACFSPGTNNFKDFEDALATRYGIKSFMCDYSSDAEKLRTPLIEGLQRFEKKWLDVRPSEINLDINDWVKRNTKPHTDLLLQMDIEGAEYRNLLHASDETLARLRIVVLEIHGLSLLAKPEFLRGIFLPVFGKLARHFVCVHVHPNNAGTSTTHHEDLVVPNTLELTFLRKDRIVQRDIPLELPHRLDAINVATKPPLHLKGALRANADPDLSHRNAVQHTVSWLESRVVSLSNELAQARKSSEWVTFMATHLLGARNVARGKPATQSSLSPHSTAEGAGGGVNGIRTGGFGFHPQVEKNPWWQVDLGSVHALDAIALYNRIGAAAERVRKLRVFVSTNGTDWSTVYDHKGGSAFGGIRPLNGAPPLLIPLDGLKARFVKLQCMEKTALHLDEVEVYGSEAT